ncbi:hypothetical protein B9S53_16205 [Arthrospira sp. O9.13F]|nr:hypothetical protein B9S53_16205 [Arthrospira sp. O9.13F]
MVLLRSELYAPRSLSTRSRRKTPTYCRIYIYTVARLVGVENGVASIPSHSKGASQLRNE